jgi:hypothetical protein
MLHVRDLRASLRAQWDRSHCRPETVTDEELIECLSFPVYRRVATMIFVPVALRHTSSVDMVVIDPRDLRGAQLQDRAADQTPEVKPTRLAKEP